MWYVDVYKFTAISLRVCEVAHDHQVQVSRYVTDELGCLNSYNTWHGMLEQFFRILIITLSVGTNNVAKRSVGRPTNGKG